MKKNKLGLANIILLAVAFCLVVVNCFIVTDVQKAYMAYNILIAIIVGLLLLGCFICKNGVFNLVVILITYLLANAFIKTLDVTAMNGVENALLLKYETLLFMISIAVIVCLFLSKKYEICNIVSIVGFSITLYQFLILTFYSVSNAINGNNDAITTSLFLGAIAIGLTSMVLKFGSNFVKQDNCDTEKKEDEKNTEVKEENKEVTEENQNK